MVTAVRVNTRNLVASVRCTRRRVALLLELEAASYKTPERVEIVGRTLLGMEPAGPDRIIVVGQRAEAPAPGGPAVAGSDP